MSRLGQRKVTCGTGRQGQCLNGTGKLHRLEGHLPGKATSCWNHHISTTKVNLRKDWFYSKRARRRGSHPETPLALNLPVTLLPAPMCPAHCLQLLSPGTCCHQGGNSHPVSLGQWQMSGSKHREWGRERLKNQACQVQLQHPGCSGHREGEQSWAEEGKGGKRLKRRDRSRAGSPRLSRHVTLTWHLMMKHPNTSSPAGELSC